MRRMGLVTLAAMAFGACLGLGSLDKGQIGIGTAEAAGGCGIGFHRGPYGGCRPNVYGAPGYFGGGVYRGGAVYGYRGGVYRRGGVYGYRGGRVYGGRGVYGRRVGVYRGGFRGGARGFHGGSRFRR